MDIEIQKINNSYKFYPKEFCCIDLEKAYDDLLSLDYYKGNIGISYSIDYYVHILPISYCPFCGKQIIYKFKKD